MDDMTKEEIEEFQERLSKLHAGAPETLAYPTRQRVRLLANLIVDRIKEDQRNGGQLLREIQRQDKKPKAKKKSS
jgi:hypothetical protein